MAYSAPSTISTGDLITAAKWNADVSANPIAIYAGALSVTSQAIGDILYASSTTQFARVAAVAAGQVLTSAGTGTVPAYSATPALTSVDMGGTTVYGSRAITVDTGGVLNVVLASSAGDDFTVDTDKLVVSGDTGYIGIGTASPVSQLDVRGPTGTGSASAGLLMLSTNELTIADGDQLGRIEFRSPLATAGSDAIVTAAAIWAEANSNFTAGDNWADIVFAMADESSTSGAVREHMRIKYADGTTKVGINTDDPGCPLHIFASTLSGPTPNVNDFFILERNGSEGYIEFLMPDDGTWGILFSAPSAQGSVMYNQGTSTVQLGINASTTGSFSKASGDFKIDHPLPEKAETHNLVHSFIEGPQCDLIYRSTVTLSSGSATVNLDEVTGLTEGTWVLLCREEQCFTSNETGWSSVRGSVTGNILTIECEDSTSTDTISWMVVANRQDPHIMDTAWTDENGHPILEPEKTEQEKEIYQNTHNNP